MSEYKISTPVERPPMAEVFGFQVPTSAYYLHRGHAWAVLESDGRVRVGLDDFPRKSGPADGLKLPEAGKVYYQDHICMALVRQGHKAPFLAPVDGTIEAINPKVRQTPGLIHDDPYGAGWLFLVKPEQSPAQSGEPVFRRGQRRLDRARIPPLTELHGYPVGVTLPEGGAIIDDVYGHYPEMGWRPLVQDFSCRS